MKRREFILGGVGGLLGANLPNGAAGQVLPCPPPLVKAAAGTQGATSCGQPAPTWLQNISVFRWVQIPGTVLSSSGAMANVPTANGSPGVRGSAWNGQALNGVIRSSVIAYSGGCINSDTSSLIVHGGGHSDYPGNEIYELKLSDDVPAWIQWFPPSQDLANTSNYGWTVTPGSGYVPGTYLNVPLRYISGTGTGAGAIANITVGAGGTVTVALSVVTKTSGAYSPGTNDVLSCANTYLGGTGSGFQLTITNGAAYNLDGTPAATHTYFQLQFSTVNNKLYRLGASSVWGNGNGGYSHVDSCTYRASGWDAARTNTDLPYSPTAGGANVDPVWQDSSGYIWIQLGSGQLMKWSPFTSPPAVVNTYTTSAIAHDMCGALDTKRNVVIHVTDHNGITPWQIMNLNSPSAWTTITMGSPAPPILPTGAQGNIVYDPINDCFWYGQANQGNASMVVYKIAAGQSAPGVTGRTWSWSIAPFSGAFPDSTGTNGNTDTYGRFNYVPALKGLVYMEDASHNVYFVRTA